MCLMNYKCNFKSSLSMNNKTNSSTVCCSKLNETKKKPNIRRLVKKYKIINSDTLLNFLIIIIYYHIASFKSIDTYVYGHEIKSVNYPLNYTNNHQWRWALRAPEACYVNLTIIDFDIPSSSNVSKIGTCIYDYLTLIDGYSGKRIGCYCNDNFPPLHILSPWNELIIQFDTNSETTGRGFYFKYEFMKLELNDRIKQQLRIQPPLSLSPTIQQLPGKSKIIDNNNPIDIPCMDGWQFFKGSCYNAYNESDPLQWYDAETKCTLHGKGLDGHLVSILDRDEMLVIHYLLTNVWKSARNREYYIGLIDVSREGVYRWSDNNPMSYTDWEIKPIVLEEDFAAQPDGGAYEDCTVIRFNSFSRTSNWQDVPCSLGKHFRFLPEKSTQSKHKNDYVDSYICKSDSYPSVTNNPTKTRLPLFSNDFLKSYQHSTNLTQNLFANNEKILKQSFHTNHYHSNGNTSDGMQTIRTKITKLHRDNLFESILSALDDNKYFVCDNYEVISVVLRCDGIAHCRDGSDESENNGCNQDCLDWQFKCANGRCISIGNYCDFVDDCGDRSDESHCERHKCKSKEFRCLNGQCIPESQRCDLLPDCSDSSDEGRICNLGCNQYSTFQCYNGICIPHYAVCDFQIDCPGKFHEDEDPIKCSLINGSNQTTCNNKTITLTPSNDYQLINHHQQQIQHFKSQQHHQTAVTVFSNTNNNCDGQQKQDLFRCTSGNMIDQSWRCLYEYDKYGYQSGCRDVSHLLDCEDFGCPQRDYVKCSNSYCIPRRYICDGKWDCNRGDDEFGCVRYVCPGQYKCANQSSCILLHQLCDGHRQCPMGDDEWFCDLQCPPQCDCIGHHVDCRGAELTAFSNNTISKSVRKLDLSYNKLGPNLTFCDFNFKDLGELILHHNMIEDLTTRKFMQLRNLYKLDLSHNLIHSVSKGAFSGLRRVTQLLLESNPELKFLQPESFLGLQSLQILNISSSKIHALNKYTFEGLSSLRHLLLRSNMIEEIEDGAFHSLQSLVSLDLRGNDIKKFTKSVFNDLKTLRNLSTDSFKFCCLMSAQIPPDRCLPPPDEISDCEDLMRYVVQRTCIWILGVVACICNIIVMAWRWRDKKVGKIREVELINSTLLLSLGISDFLMSVYLIIIASVDAWYRGRYIENVDIWRQSTLCKFCGFVSTVSIQVSVFTLALIALNRYIEICHPMGSPYKFTINFTHRLIASSWSLALIIAFLPLIVTPYFHDQFYARSGVCLAFHITNQKAAGWEYSIVVFLCINLIAFVIIITCYTFIYRKITRTVRHGGLTPNHPVKIALILSFNFLSWSPTIIMGFIALGGHALPSSVYSWIAVLVLPINSAINPMIYTMPNIWHEIKDYISSHRARKSGSMIPNQNVVKNASSIIKDKLTEKWLTIRNVPPGYKPLKDYMKSTSYFNHTHLVKIALEIVKDIESKHLDNKVYNTLNLNCVYVSDCIMTSDSKLTVFLTDHDGYRPKRSQCTHHHHKHKSSHPVNCECYDVTRFGDILLKLLQFYTSLKNLKQDFNPLVTNHPVNKIRAIQYIKNGIDQAENSQCEVSPL